MTRHPVRIFPGLCAVVLLAALTGGCGPRYDPKCSATQLHWAAGLRDPSQIEKALQAGVPIDARDQGGNTPLMYAASDGSKRNVKALIDAGADVNAQNQDGRTALMSAATARWHDHHGVFRPHEEVITSVRLLIEAGADPMLRNNEGATALHAAAGFGDPERFELLISAGAEIEARDRHGLTPGA